RRTGAARCAGPGDGADNELSPRRISSGGAVTKAKARSRVGKRLRIMVLMHEDLIPPDSLDGYTDKEMQEWKTEYDVVVTLREMGHDVRPLGLWDDLGKLRKEIDTWQPHIAFNL